MVSALFAVGIMTILTYFVALNLSLFIGLSLCLIGVLTANRSVVCEMQFKKYSGPDVFGGFVLLVLGLTVMEQSMFGLILGCFPVLAGMLGLWFTLDWLLSLLVRKKQEWFTCVAGIICLSLSAWLLLTMNFGSINALLCGLFVIGYSIFIFHKEFFTKDNDIKVEKVQEDYD